MIRFKNGQRKFSLRKLSVGVASVAIASFFSAQVASAEELNSVVTSGDTSSAVASTLEKPATEALSSTAKNIEMSFEEDVTVIKEDLIDGKTAGDIATKEIETSLARPVIEEDQAKTGDLVKVEGSVSEPILTEKEDKDKVIATSEIKAKVTSTYKSDASAPIGKQDPVTETYETFGVYETASTNITAREVVTKVTTIENIKTGDTTTDVVQGQNADVVFIIDTSGSMFGTIKGVVENITNFVNGLNQESITTRLGLVGYGTTHEVFQFGDSYFTTDTVAFVESLNNLLRKSHGASEDPTKPLKSIASDYDWSKAEDVARFAVVFTDEDINTYKDESQSIFETVAALNKANVSASFVYKLSDKNSVAEFTPIIEGTGGDAVDITQDYSEMFTKNLTNWIVTKVNDNTRYYQIVTETYTLFTEIIATEKKQEFPRYTPKPLAISPIKEVPKPVTASKPSAPVQETKVSQIAPQPKSVVNIKELPKTGDASSHGLSGLGVLSAMTLLAGLLRRRKL